MHVAYHPEILPTDQQGMLSAEESQHMLKVLRMQAKQAFAIANGKGQHFEAEISEIRGKNLLFTVLSVNECPHVQHWPVHIAVAPTKNIDRIAWFVEKATEIGIQRISLLDTRYTERKKLKMDRLEKIAVAAMKQSQRFFLPQLEGLIPFAKFIEQLPEGRHGIALVKAKHVNLWEWAERAPVGCVLIGPEGGFDDEEIALAESRGLQPLSLGNYRLRTETAAITACTALNFAQKPAIS